jgi:hypothetical protein
MAFWGCASEPMTELEERILNFVAVETRAECGRIELDSVLQDSGMDGDEAGEFFLTFGDEFHVDLIPLTPHWRDHFRSQGLPKGCMVVTGSAVIAGFLIHLAFPPVPAWAAIIGLILVLGWGCRKVFNYYEHEEKEPITVQDLVDAAIAGKWVKSYGKQENRQP